VSGETSNAKAYIQYFSQVIIETGQDLNQDSDLTEFQNAHALLLEINKFAPSILLSVIPQLEEEMKVEYNSFLIY
jgi:sister-chromatid-cohesion protein PDS5